MAIDVHLEMFEGPLDLLLFLIKKNDLDVYDIPIAQITQEYLSYLDLMKELNLDTAGEFLVLASTLMGIKAKMLLPSHEGDENEGPDPRAELVAKLVEYQKFKQAAAFLEKRADEFKDVFYRGVPTFDESEKSLAIGMLDLMGALREVLERAEDDAKEVLGEEFPIEEKMEKVLFLLKSSNGSVTWDDVFADERKRRGIIACFLALLELTKLQKIFIRQDANFAKIAIFLKVNQEAPSDASPSDAPAAAADGRGAQEGS